MSKCAYCKKRIGWNEYFDDLTNGDFVHDHCLTDYEYQKEKRKLELEILRNNLKEVIK